MEGGLQELDETVYWLELLVGSKTVLSDEMQGLLDETEELIAIFTASVITAKKRKQQ